MVLITELQVNILLAALSGYFLGSIPFGVVLVALTGKGDLRNIGSGNIGATNVLRTGSKSLAFATLLLDGGKGAVAVLLANNYGELAALAAGLGAFIGHLYPLWLRFRGGKGVATTVGILLALSWPVGLLVCLTWFVSALCFRISSLAALIALALAPVYAFGIVGPRLASLSLILTIISWWKHRENIGRLRAGTEPRIGDKKKKKTL